MINKADVGAGSWACGMARAENGVQNIIINTNPTLIPTGHKCRIESPGILDVRIGMVDDGRLAECNHVNFVGKYERMPLQSDGF